MSQPREINKILDDLQSSLIQILGTLDHLIKESERNEFLEYRQAELKQAAGQLRATITFLGRARRM